MRINIHARDLQVGDVWLGIGTRMTMLEILGKEYRLALPFHASRSAPPVMLDHVQVFARLEQPDERPATYQYTIQGDTPIEVDRP